MPLLPAIYLSLREPKAPGGLDWRASHGGAGLRVIRRDPGLFRLANEGREVEERRQRYRDEIALRLRLTRRGGGGEKACGDKHIPARVWTGYVDGFGFIRLRATNQNTLGRT